MKIYRHKTLTHIFTSNFCGESPENFEEYSALTDSDLKRVAQEAFNAAMTIRTYSYPGIRTESMWSNAFTDYWEEQQARKGEGVR